MINLVKFLKAKEDFPDLRRSLLNKFNSKKALRVTLPYLVNVKSTKPQYMYISSCNNHFQLNMKIGNVFR